MVSDSAAKVASSHQLHRITDEAVLAQDLQLRRAARERVGNTRQRHTRVVHHLVVLRTGGSANTQHRKASGRDVLDQRRAEQEGNTTGIPRVLGEKARSPHTGGGL